MIAPTIPDNEEQRQIAVERYEILDTLPEACFDDITTLVAQFSDAPISLITMLDHDRNYLKSHHGVPFSESPRNISFCGHTINSPDEIMIVEDARLDERFHDNPLVSEFKAIFYAGVPLCTPDGFKLGTLCLYDHRPRTLSTHTVSMLLKMAKQVEQILDLRLKNTLLLATKNQLENHNDALAEFARAISHDIKSPLSSLLYLTDTLIEDSDAIEKDDLTRSLKRIKSSATSLTHYADDLLTFYLSSDTTQGKVQFTQIKEVFREVQLLLGSSAETHLSFSTDCETAAINKASINQILLNLVSNAIKYSDKESVEIQVNCKLDEQSLCFTVSDNGMGIALEKLDSIFDLFNTTGNIDRDGRIGTGIGLSTVKQAINGLGGDIWVTSKLGIGTTFTFTIPVQTTQSKGFKKAA